MSECQVVLETITSRLNLQPVLRLSLILIGDCTLVVGSNFYRAKDSPRGGEVQHVSVLHLESLWKQFRCTESSALVRRDEQPVFPGPVFTCTLVSTKTVVGKSEPCIIDRHIAEIGEISAEICNYYPSRLFAHGLVNEDLKLRAVDKRRLAALRIIPFAEGERNRFLIYRFRGTVGIISKEFDGYDGSVT